MLDRLPTGAVRLCAARGDGKSILENLGPLPEGGTEPVSTGQLNSEETLSSLAMRAIASPIRGAIEITRMLRATLTASVG